MAYTSELVLFCAFRYALGRRTYVVEEVAKELIRHKADLTPYMRTQICKEIDVAQAEGRIGMQMDLNQWDTVRKAFRE